jgi:hypothetical protein
MRWLARATALLITLATSVHAEESHACAQFKWPLTIEKSWFETGKLEGLASGATVATLAEGAFTVTLKPATEVPFKLKLKPEGKPKANRPLGAIISFETVKARQYQVTLSDEAWIDVVQADAYPPSLEFSGVHGCLARDRKSGHRFSVDHALNLRFRSRLSLQAEPA